MAIGENAYQAASAPVRRAFGYTRKLPNLDYAAAVALLHGVSIPAIVSGQPQSIRAHAPIRAHSKK